MENCSLLFDKDRKKNSLKGNFVNIKNNKIKKAVVSEEAVFYYLTILGGSMNRSELINSLSEETAFSKKDVTRVLDSLIRIIERTLRKGDKVSITGFGTYWVSRRPARKGINPATKERINLPEVSVPRFKPGKHLRELIRSS